MLMKWVFGVVLFLVTAYLALFGMVAFTMSRPPEQFGQIMKRLPMPVVWGVVPGPRIWNWARRGSLSEGELAPDFTLRQQEATEPVRLSSYRGKEPVVLIFGSYT
jgi:hypothetical protein